MAFQILFGNFRYLIAKYYIIEKKSGTDNLEPVRNQTETLTFRTIWSQKQMKVELCYTNEKTCIGSRFQDHRFASKQAVGNHVFFFNRRK